MSNLLWLQAVNWRLPRGLQAMLRLDLWHVTPCGARRASAALILASIRSRSRPYHWSQAVLRSQLIQGPEA